MCNDIMPCEEIWDKIHCGGYNGEVDEDIIKVMSAINELNPQPPSTTMISAYLSINRNYIELIQYIICTMDYAEYGTSPRCCWLTDKGKEMLKLFKERLEEE